MLKKTKIPIALKQQVWLKHNGETFKAKCMVKWCSNQITVFNFHAGHNIPEAQNGPTIVDNLFPICATCNLSMGSNYTIDQFSDLIIVEQVDTKPRIIHPASPHFLKPDSTSPSSTPSSKKDSSSNGDGNSILWLKKFFCCA